MTGTLIDPPIPTPYPAALAPFANGRPFVQSPENPSFARLSAAERQAAANLPSSRGFEGMALNTSGTRLYPLLEGALTTDPVRDRLLLQEYDLATAAYTGSFWFYRVDSPSNAIGDLTAINDREFLVIERDNNQGTAAAFKRIYRINLTDGDEHGYLRKTLVADLLAIDDRAGLTQGEDGAVGLGPVFQFPFQTIESVFPIDADTLLVIDDNNYPFSSRRRPGRAPDDTEFILIQVNAPLDRADTTCGDRPTCSSFK